MKGAVLVRGARQLVTLRGPSGPRRGAALRELGILENGAILIQDGVVTNVGQGRRVENLREARGAEEIDVSGRVVLPGFVDSHTHLVWGPPGLSAPTQRVQLPPSRTLARSGRERLLRFIRHGTTTLESKAGCGLDRAGQVKSLRVAARLAQSALDLVSTYVGLHGVPAGFDGGPGEYVDWVISDMLPSIGRRGLARYADLCHGHGGFSADDLRRYLQVARRCGLGVKVHSTESSRGSVRLAIEMGAVSAGIPGLVEGEEITLLAQSQTIATLLPGSSFQANLGDYPPGRGLVDQGAAVALATGFTPSLPTCNMQMALALACARMQMTPAEAISAATINGAHALGLAGRLGSLQNGMQADLAVFDVPDYREIPYHFGVDLVIMTMKRGVVLYRRGEVQWPAA